MAGVVTTWFSYCCLLW